MNPLVTEARALCEGATGELWIRALENDGDSWTQTNEIITAREGHTVAHVVEEGDADLIASARTLIPEMAAEIERLEAELSTEREKSRIMRPIVLDGQSAENFCHVVELSELREESQRLQSELDALKADIEAGRLVRLNIQPEEDYDGLKVKYQVFKARDGSPVENCFVLRPDKDDAARSALARYASVADNNALRNDILQWIARLDAQEAEARAAMEEDAE